MEKTIGCNEEDLKVKELKEELARASRILRGWGQTFEGLYDVFPPDDSLQTPLESVVQQRKMLYKQAREMEQALSKNLDEFKNRLDEAFRILQKEDKKLSPRMVALLEDLAPTSKGMYAEHDEIARDLADEVTRELKSGRFTQAELYQAMKRILGNYDMIDAFSEGVRNFMWGKK
jgi:DNA repair ATPase RecN